MIKEIPEFENLYFCDEEGNLYSNINNVRIKDKAVDPWINNLTFPLKKLNPVTRWDGYKSTTLRNANGKRRGYLVHKLIALTFLGIGLEKYIAHRDGNFGNNHVSNLYETNKSEMLKKVFREGRMSSLGENHSRYYVDEKVKEKVRELLDQGKKQREISTLLGVSAGIISRIKNKKHFTDGFRYDSEIERMKKRKER